jgi:hypothetical protein
MEWAFFASDTPLLFHPHFLQHFAIANRNAKSQLADNQKDMLIFFAFLQFCNFLVSKQTNRGDGLHLIVQKIIF